MLVKIVEADRFAHMLMLFICYKASIHIYCPWYTLIYILVM